MVPGKPLYSLTCAWSSRYNPVTEVEGPGADGDTDVILYMSLLDHAVAAVMTAHFQLLYTLLLPVTVTQFCHGCCLRLLFHVSVTVVHVAVYCCCLLLLLHVTVTVVHVTVTHYCWAGRKRSPCMYMEAQLHQAPAYVNFCCWSLQHKPIACT